MASSRKSVSGLEGGEGGGLEVVRGLVVRDLGLVVVVVVVVVVDEVDVVVVVDVVAVDEIVGGGDVEVVVGDEVVDGGECVVGVEESVVDKVEAGLEESFEVVLAVESDGVAVGDCPGAVDPVDGGAIWGRGSAAGCDRAEDDPETLDVGAVLGGADWAEDRVVMLRDDRSGFEVVDRLEQCAGQGVGGGLFEVQGVQLVHEWVLVHRSETWWWQLGTAEIPAWCRPVDVEASGQALQRRGVAVEHDELVAAVAAAAQACGCDGAAADASRRAKRVGGARFGALQRVLVGGGLAVDAQAPQGQL